MQASFANADWDTPGDMVLVWVSLADKGRRRTAVYENMMCGASRLTGQVDASSPDGAAERVYTGTCGRGTIPAGSIRRKPSGIALCEGSRSTASRGSQQDVPQSAYTLEDARLGRLTKP